MNRMASALNRFEHHDHHLQGALACVLGIESLLLPSDHRPAYGPRVPVGWLVTATATAMRRYPSTTTVQAGGCSVIKRLADYLERVPHVLRKEGIVSLALAAMERLPANPDVQAFCAGAVGSSLVALSGEVDFDDDDDEEEVERAPALLVTAMRAFPADRDVQLYGCFALGELDASGFVERGATRKAGAWGVVASALSRFRNDEPTLECCCTAVSAMSRRDPRKVPEAVGAAVDAALAAFTGEDDVIRPCIEAQETLWLSSIDHLLSIVGDG
jgi:hypothetical protein